ncbi:MAG: hypothetical protein MI784_10120, partial [Cytophagales bacterium]|nr:hypothetical protein [Cytophagales bacterium]
MKEQLEHLIQSSTLLRPEVLLLALLLVFILLASFSVKNKPLLYSLAAIGLILTAGLNTELLHVSSQSKTLSFFHGLMVMDATGIAA